MVPSLHGHAALRTPSRHAVTMVTIAPLPPHDANKKSQRYIFSKLHQDLLLHLFNVYVQNANNPKSNMDADHMTFYYNLQD